MVSFEAGSVCDACGYPAPHWSCRVVYMYNEIDKVYWVYSVQVVGFGVVDDKVTRETTMESLQEVDHYLGYIKSLEMCYKKVYGE